MHYYTIPCPFKIQKRSSLIPGLLKLIFDLLQWDPGPLALHILLRNSFLQYLKDQHNLASNHIEYNDSFHNTTAI